MPLQNDDATSRSLSNATLSAAACADGDHNRCYPCTGKEQVTSRPEAAHLGEDLWQYVLDILDVDLVDKSIKGLTECIPRHALVLIATFVAFLFHHLNAAQVCLQHHTVRLLQCAQRLHTTVIATGNANVVT